MAFGPDNATVLSHSQLFRGISVAELQDLISHAKIIKTESGEPLVQEGAIMPGLHVVLEGSAQVVKRGQPPLTQIGRGAFFGEISLFGMALAATASIVALDACSTLVITRSELGAWFKRHPQLEVVFLRHLATELCNRLYSTTDKLAHGSR